MVNYSFGKIYKIEPTVAHDIDDIYIGSTCEKYLSTRYSKHKSAFKTFHNPTTSIKLFNKYGDNLHIVLLELVNATCRDELVAREKHYIATLKCVNKVYHIKTPDELIELEEKQNICKKEKQNFNEHYGSLLTKYPKFFDKFEKGDEDFKFKKYAYNWLHREEIKANKNEYRLIKNKQKRDKIYLECDALDCII